MCFFTSDVYNNHNLWSCQKVCDALVYLLDNIFIRFGTKLYRQTIGIPMGTNCAPLVADLFLFCYERDFMKSLSRENQADIIEAFNSTSRYLDDLLNIDNIYFDQMVVRIYPTELQKNRANSSDTEALFLDLNLYISNGTVSTKIYDKQDDFDFDIVNFPFLDGDVPRRTSYGVYISQLIRFARASSNLNDFNYRNKALTAKFFRQGYRYFKLCCNLLYVFPCVILFLCFSVRLVLRLPRLGKRELNLVLFVRLFGLCLFRFVGFFFLLESGKGCGL